jgi:hypothetical protein
MAVALQDTRTTPLTHRHPASNSLGAATRSPIAGGFRQGPDEHNVKTAGARKRADRSILCRLGTDRNDGGGNALPRAPASSCTLDGRGSKVFLPRLVEPNLPSADRPRWSRRGQEVWPRLGAEFLETYTVPNGRIRRTRPSWQAASDQWRVIPFSQRFRVTSRPSLAEHRHWSFSRPLRCWRSSSNDRLQLLR